MSGHIVKILLSAALAAGSAHCFAQSAPPAPSPDQGVPAAAPNEAMPAPGARIAPGTAAAENGLAAAPSPGVPPAARPGRRAPLRPVFHQPGGSAGQANLRISFKIRDKELAASGNLVVQSGAQANYVTGGEIPHVVENAQGKGGEFKKSNAIINCLPSVIPGSDQATVQIQVEVSGPLAPVTELKINPIETFQFQTEFTATLGRPIVLVDEPDRRLEVTLEELPRK